MLTRLQVTEIVISEIQKYFPNIQNVSEETRIIEDLKISGDDDIFLVWDIQKKTGVKGSNKDWLAAKTVGDMINLILKEFDKSQ